MALINIKGRMHDVNYAQIMQAVAHSRAESIDSVDSPFHDPAHEGGGDKAPQRLQLLDDPQEWPVFGRSLPATTGQAACWESQVVLEGMHCAACALTIEQALLQVPGVTGAQVNAATRRARITWQPSQVLPSRWIEAVRRAGYQAIPARDAFATELRQQEQRRALWRWLVAGLCMMQVMMYAWPSYVSQPGDMAPDSEQLLRWASWVLTLPVMLFSCSPFFASAWRDIRQRRVSMDLPVALGMLVTFIVSSSATFDPQGILGREVYFDSLTMFVFFLLTGRWLELRLRDRTAGALEALLNRMPDSVERQNAAGSFERVAVRRLLVGDVIRVLPGEGFPVDGEILEGQTFADEALLTGESTPVPRGPGSWVTAGSHNLSVPVVVRVDRLGAQTRFAEIVALIERASMDKPRLAMLADRWARPFLLGVLAAAAGSAAVWWTHDPGHALMVAVSVLIVTCPCALSLATPAAMLAAAGALARRGVLVRELQAFEVLAGVDTVVFDKTGTLTRDGMTVREVRVREGVSAAQALTLAAALAHQSLHPVSRAVHAAWQAKRQINDSADRDDALSGRFEDVHESVGMGLEGRLPGTRRAVRLGSAAWCGVGASEVNAERSEVYLSDHEGWVATFELQEDVREDAVQAVQLLRGLGLNVMLLSGDKQAAVDRVATALGIDLARGECTPAQKLDRLRQLQQQGHRLVMVGDGLNDGPILAGSDTSFAFGQAVPLAQSRSDFVVLGGQLVRVPQAVALARKTLAVVRENLVWAAIYNAVCVPLAVVGWLPPWLAGLGMALSSLLVVLNASRLSFFAPATKGL